MWEWVPLRMLRYLNANFHITHKSILDNPAHAYLHHCAAMWMYAEPNKEIMIAITRLWFTNVPKMLNVSLLVINYTNWSIASSLYFNRGLTHWGRVTQICVSNLTTIGSVNGLSPGRRQAITWTNAGILLIGPLGTNFSEILIEIPTFSFTKMRLKVSSAKWRPFCLGLNVLISLNHCWSRYLHPQGWTVRMFQRIPSVSLYKRK